ncbi:MAG: hypothetical protein JXB49_19305 [Bacteroidales bacterium]|nr:hypothetical protein [Bacteroidales bacterium]
MKTYILIPLLFIHILVSAQENSNTKVEFDFIMISGSFGAGGVISTNIVNSGAVIPGSIDFLGQIKHQRYGFGVTHELYLTPENLVKLVLGESSNTEKYYFMYEWTVFKNSPVNLGVSTQFGGFYVGNEADIDDDDSFKNRMFLNGGLIVEAGLPRYFFFVRPALEYKSYGPGSWHKELLATVSVGFRVKLLTEEGKAKKGKHSQIFSDDLPLLVNNY